MRNLTYIAILTTFLSCQKKSDSNQESYEDAQVNIYQNLPENEAGAIVKKAIVYAGGLEVLAEKGSIKYDKVITSYDSTGEITRQYTQVHEYNLDPFKARMTWVTEADTFVILNNGKQAWKLQNGEIMTDQDHINSAYNSSFGSHYTLLMPFKLADPNTNLEYQGITTLPSGIEAHAILTTYEEGAGSAPQHIWWYYFDKDSYELIGNMISSNGFGYAAYTGMQDVEGLKIALARNSHRSDSLKTEITLSTNYSNQNVSFGESYPDSYFEPEK